MFQGLFKRTDWERAVKIPIAVLPGGSGNGLSTSLVEEVSVKEEIVLTFLPPALPLDLLAVHVHLLPSSLLLAPPTPYPGLSHIFWSTSWNPGSLVNLTTSALLPQPLHACLFSNFPSFVSGDEFLSHKRNVPNFFYTLYEHNGFSLSLLNYLLTKLFL